MWPFKGSAVHRLWSLGAKMEPNHQRNALAQYETNGVGTRLKQLIANWDEKKTQQDNARLVLSDSEYAHT